MTYQQLDELRELRVENKRLYAEISLLDGERRRLNVKIERLREHTATMVREREDERRFFNTAIANHLAEIERRTEALATSRELRKFDQAEIKRLKDRIDGHHIIFEPMRVEIERLKETISCQTSEITEQWALIKRLRGEW